jgi:hypothetical protein
MFGRLKYARARPILEARMRSWHGGLRAATALLGAAVATSCEGPSGPGINPVDFLLAEANGSWSISAASYLALAHAPSSPIRVSADDCKYSFSKSLFVCPRREWDGMTFDLSYQLLDAANASLTTYDARTVTSVRTLTTIAGTKTFDSTASQAIVSSGDRTLSGLLGGDPTVNGSEYATFIFHAGSFHDTTYTATSIANFKVPPRNSPEFPTGVITTQYYSVPPDTFVDPDGTFTLTFDGSQFAKSVWSFAGYSVMCTFDLKGVNKTTCTP